MTRSILLEQIWKANNKKKFFDLSWSRKLYWRTDEGHKSFQFLNNLTLSKWTPDNLKKVHHVY